MHKYISVVLFIFFSSGAVFSQQLHTLLITATDSSENKLLNSLSKQLLYQQSFNNGTEVYKELQLFLLKLYDNGYLAASFDSVVQDLLHTSAFLHLHKKYRWAFLDKGNVDEDILNEAGYRKDLFKNKPVHYKEAAVLQEKILVYCENHGFPFASVKLNDIRFSGDTISASLLLNKNRFIVIDSIVVRGDAKIADVYLFNYLSMKPGGSYNESLINKISVRLLELPFVKELQPFHVLFTDTSCKVVLYLEDREASRIDGIAGLASDSSKAGRITLTGEAHLKLLSSLGRGETIELNWKNPKPKTQDLKTRLVYPFIISRFGLDFFFSIYKNDTLYMDVVKNIGVQYLLPGGNYLKAFVHNTVSTLLSPKSFKNATSLPAFADMNSSIYGMGMKSEKTDYRLNPRKGYFFEITAGAGNKTIKKNPDINPALYKNVSLHSANYRIEYHTEFYFPLKKRAVVNLGVEGAHLINHSILQNELFRIGGLKSLRGFDEESISASSYNIVKLEYRYLLEQNSYLFLFMNVAYYENRSINFKQDRYDTPYGFGTGITFETKIGIFSVNYALGKQFDNPVLFRSGKVHFGIVNYF